MGIRAKTGNIAPIMNGDFRVIYRAIDLLMTEIDNNQAQTTYVVNEIQDVGIRTLAYSNISIIAGNGLVGGGDLSADRRFDVAVASGLFVVEDAVGIDYRAPHTYIPSGDFTSITVEGEVIIVSGLTIGSEHRPSGIVDIYSLVGAWPTKPDSDILSIGPYIWFDAASGITLSGSQIASWVPKYTTGSYASATASETISTGPRPWVEADGDGYTRVRFDNGAALRSFGSISYLPSSDFTVVAYYRPTSYSGTINVFKDSLLLTGGKWVGFARPGGFPTIQSAYDTANNAEAYYTISAAYSGIGVTSSGQLIDYPLLGMVGRELHGSLVANVSGLGWLNNLNGSISPVQIVSPNGSDEGATSIDANALGWATANGGYVLYETIVFSGMLTSTQIDTVANYFRGKYQQDFGGTLTRKPTIRIYTVAGDGSHPLESQYVSGNLGLGTGTGSIDERLHVSGNIKATGTIYAPTVSGSTNVYAGTLVQAPSVIGTTSISGATVYGTTISGNVIKGATSISGLLVQAGTLTVRGVDTDSRYLLSGLYQTSGTSYTKTESDVRYQLSGFPAEGSGLYQAGTTYHVGSGWGITVSDSGVTAKAADLDVRYALSGTGGGGATTLDGLTDVVITAASSGQKLGFDGTNWVNENPGAGTGDITGTGTSGSIPVFDAAKNLINSIVAQVDLATNYGLNITDPYTGAVATLVPDYYSLGLARIYALPPTNAGFGAFLVGSQESGIIGHVPYYSEAAIVANSDWKFSTTSLLSGIDLQAISGTFQKLSVRGQDTDARYALSGTAGGGGASVLDDLTDVTLTTPVSGNYLGYNGTIWVNTGVTATVDPSSFEGSGLYVADTKLHVGAGWGITVSDSGVTAKASDLDVRYALSGTGGGGSSPTYTINASGQIDVRVILASGVIPNGGTASTIIWSGISQAYDYLEVRGMMRSNAPTTVVHVAMYLNNDTTDGNYLTRRIEADSSAFTSVSYDAPFVGIGQALQQLNTDGGDVSPLHFIIPAYSQAGHRKWAYTVGPVPHNFADTSIGAGIYSVEWENTSGPAVNMIELRGVNATNTFTSGTELYLIGVRKQWAVTSGSYGSMNISNGIIVP